MKKILKNGYILIDIDCLKGFPGHREAFLFSVAGMMEGGYFWGEMRKGRGWLFWMKKLRKIKIPPLEGGMGGIFEWFWWKSKIGTF